MSNKLLKAIKSFQVVVLSGARQTGKTTILQHLFPEWDFVTFDPVTDIEGARGDPDLFLDNHPAPLILDEIQYATAVVAALKRRVDREKNLPGQYILTGSQQWQVMRILSESMAGRAVFVDLHGLSMAELHDAPAGGWVQHWLADGTNSPVWKQGSRSGTLLHRQLFRGTLPGLLQIDDEWVPTFWDSYQRTYIERDARAMAELGDWHQFGLFLRLAGALSAQEINLSHLGREIGVVPNTARKWLDILRSTFQWHEVPAWQGNLVKRVVGKAKGYLSDTGMICHGQRVSASEALAAHPMQGSLFETAVVNEIRSQLSGLAYTPALWHWRSTGGAEVDLILEKDGMLFPIEIRLTSNPRPRDASGLNAFRSAYPGSKIASGLIICASDKPRAVTENVYAIPWDWLIC